MGGKYNDGFTKQAQKGKFIRNRDIKLKESEIKKEQKTQKLMCEGICRRCREKLQWRFKYDKYKPLKNPATCQQCKNKTIVKAYRTLCEKCAHGRNVCPGCVDPIVPEEHEEGGEKEGESLGGGKVSFAEASMVLEGKESGVQKKASTTASSSSSIVKKFIAPRKKKDIKDDDEDEVESEFVWGEEVHNGQIVGGTAIVHDSDEEDDDEDNEEEEDDDEEEGDDEDEEEGDDEDVDEEAVSEEEGEEVEGETATVDESAFQQIGMDIAWNEKKFLNIAASKYSKSRPTGTEAPTYH